MTTVRTQVDEDFVVFVKEVEPRLALALTAAYGPEVGRESTADALAYAWEHWTRVRDLGNPAGYLYRVGQSAARRYHRNNPLFPAVPPAELPHVEPGLPAALNELSASQRTAVMLIHVEGMSEREAARVLDVHRSTVRRHCDRGLAKLRDALEVKDGD